MYGGGLLLAKNKPPAALFLCTSWERILIKNYQKGVHYNDRKSIQIHLSVRTYGAT